MTRKGGSAERPRKRLYAIPEAAESLGRTPWAIRVMILKGKLPAVRDGRRILLNVEALDKWIEINKVVRNDD